MATDGFVQVPPDAGGKKIDTDERINFSGQTVERQRITIPDGVVVSGDALDRIWTEQRVLNLLMASAFGIPDDLNMLGDLAANGFGGPLSQLVCPLLIGGVSSTSTLTLESTNGTGTTDGIFFKTGTQSERMRIDSSGNVITGGAASFSSLFGDVPGLQLNFSSSAGLRAIASLAGWTNSFGGPGLYFTKSRGTTIGAQVAVQVADQVGFIGFGGSDGSTFQSGASIAATVEGTVAGGSVPTRLSFFTGTNGSGAERLRIDNNGSVIIGGFASLNTSVPLQLISAGASQTSSISMYNYSTANNQPDLVFANSNSATYNTNGITTAGSFLSRIMFYGNDGAGFQRAVMIRAEADATFTAGHAPGILKIFTSSATAQDQERVRIDSNGFVTAGGSANNLVHSINTVIQGNQVVGNNWDLGTITWNTGSTLGVGGWIQASSRGATIGTQGLVGSGDSSLWLAAWASDGAAFQETQRIWGQIDGTPAANAMPGRLLFGTNAGGTTIVERVRIDSTGQVIIGGVSGSGYTTPTQAYFNINATSSSPFDVTLNHFTNDNSGVAFQMYKSRATTIGGSTIVANNDSIGIIGFYGDGGGGNTYLHAGYIAGYVDGTPSATAMPSRLVFATVPASSTTNTERMRIDSGGNIIVGTAALATNATNGFLYVDTCAGVPSGTPTTYTGRAPLIYDTTDNRLYIFNSSWQLCTDTNAWTQTTPTVTPSTGSFTSASMTLRTKQIGKICYFAFVFVVTTVGTASGNANFSTGINSVASGINPAFAFLDESAGTAGVCQIGNGGSTLTIIPIGGTWSAHTYSASGTYETT